MIESKRSLSSSAIGKKGIQARVLEPRVLFDAAAVETVATVADAADAPPPVDTSTLFEAPATTRHEAYFIDSSVEGHEALLAQVPPGAEVFIIDRSQSGIEQINAALAATGGTFDAIHIISHGNAGSVRIGSDVLNNTTINGYQQSLSQLGTYLGSDADILLYGCDVASSGEGAMLMVNIANMTGADVAASADATGGSVGNAELEAQAGTVTTDPWAAVSLLQQPLALDGVYGGREDGDTTNDQLGYAVDASGEWVVAGGGTTGAGEVQVWRINGTSRDQQKLTVTGATAGFGRGVAIDGTTLVVGETGRGTSSRGLVHVFQLNTSTNVWSFAATIDIGVVAGVGAAMGPWSDGTYSTSQWLDISGNHIAVGIPNEGSATGQVVWLADTSASLNWSSYASGSFNEPGGFASDTAPAFGASVAVANGILVIGSPGADGNGDEGLYGGGNTGNHGRVFIYDWASGATAAPNASPAVTLVGQQDVDGVNGGDGVTNARFGAAVATDFFGGKYTIAVGAPGEGGGDGEIYIYQTSGTAITGIGAASNIYGQTTDLDADGYGLAVSVSQGKILVGAPRHTANTDVGVWYYESTNNNWAGLDTNNPAANGIYVKTFTASTYSGAGTNNFGRGVALSLGNVIAAGAPQYQAGAITAAGTVAFYFARTPWAVNDTDTTTETASKTISILTNDLFGTENPSTAPLALLDGTNSTLNTKIGEGTWTLNGDRTVTYNPGTRYDYLAAGETATVSMQYRLTAQLGGVAFTSTARITVTITGQNDAPTVSTGLSNISAPRRNEPVGVPAGPSSYSTGSVVIPISAFDDVDTSNTLTYTLVSTAKLSGDASLPASLAAGVVTVGGTYNIGTGVNSGLVSYNLSSLTNTLYQNSTWTVTVRATDNAGAFVNTTFVLSIGRDNENPAVLSPIPNYSGVAEDAIFTQVLTGYFTDPDEVASPSTEDLTYSITSQAGPGASWLGISAGGTISGTPSNDNVGLHTVVVRATDVFGNYIEDTFTVTVTNTNDVPLVTNEIDRKIAIKGESWGFNVTTGQVTWNGVNQTIDDAGPYFTDVDNSTADGRTPNSGDVITYRAYDAVTGQEITTTAGSTNATWLRFNGTSFSSAVGVTNALGAVITIRLDATDRIGSSGGPVGGTTSQVFEIGVYPRDGAAAISTALPAAAAGGRLGFDVALNSDNGRWAVVGQPGASTGDGQALVYENTNFGSATTAPSWTLRATLTPAALSDGRFGTSVDISADGRYIVVGAPLDTAGAGAVYFYSNTTQGGAGVPGSWVAAGTPKVAAPAGDNNAGDRFGSAVAINENGSTVLVGAPLDDAGGTNAGAAYSFAWGTAPVAGNKRLPTTDGGTDSRAGDMYGSTVAFDQNMQVVGAYRDDHSGKVDAGSVYVYSTDNTSFTKLKKSSNVGNSDYFGWSVDVESFATRNSVVVAVGAYNDDTIADNAGAVYIFRSDTMTTDNGDGNGVLGSLVQNSVITAYDASALDGIGFSVAVDVEGDALAGALRVATGGNINGTSPGYIYAYRYWAGYGWTGQRFQAATDASTNNQSNQFGYAVDIAGSRILAGAPNAERSTTNVAGLYYSVGLAVTGSTSAIETTPLSGNFPKEVGSATPAPVTLSNAATRPTGSGFDWMLLLKPIENWSAQSVADWRVQGIQEGEGSAIREKAGKSNSTSDSIAAEMLFDLRTLKGKSLARSLQALSVDAPQKGGATKDGKLPNSEAAQEQSSEGTRQPAGSKAAPDKNKQDSANAAPQGLTTQLEAAQAARSRKARDLVASLSALTS